MTAEFGYLEPWYAVDDAEESVGLQVTPRHVLFGRPITMIARRSDSDDVLYLLVDGQVAEVRLSWSEHSEADPNWPWTAIFPSLQVWAEQSMLPAHLAYTD